MNKNEILDSVGYIDEKWIIEYEEAKNANKKPFLKWILPFAACLIVIAVMIPTFFRYNAPDREYEARHFRFFSAAEAEKALGTDFLFTRLKDREKTEITLGVAKGGSLSDRSSWTDIEYYTEDGNGTVDVMIFLPSFTGMYPDHLSSDPAAVMIGETEVKYSYYEKGSPMCYECDYFAAQFEYAGNWFEYTVRYASGGSVDRALADLGTILGN